MRDGRILSAEELPQQMACRTAKPVMNTELDLVFDDGERRKLFGHAVPLFDEEGRVRGSVSAYLDVTEQRNAEEALRCSEALAAVSRLANTLAHELNNPLQAATNLMYLLHSSPDSPAHLRELVLDTEQRVNRVRGLLQQTLDLYGKLVATNSD
jgi:signal transduction histidine kinase